MDKKWQFKTSLIFSILFITASGSFLACSSDFTPQESSSRVVDQENPKSAARIDLVLPVSIYPRNSMSPQYKTMSDLQVEADNEELKVKLRDELAEVRALLLTNSNGVIALTFEPIRFNHRFLEDRLFGGSQLNSQGVEELFGNNATSVGVNIIKTSLASDSGSFAVSSVGAIVLYNSSKRVSGVRAIFKLLNQIFQKSGDLNMVGVELFDNQGGGLYSCVFTNDAQKSASLRDQNVLSLSRSCDNSFLDYCKLQSFLKLRIESCLKPQILNPALLVPGELEGLEVLPPPAQPKGISLKWQRTPFAAFYRVKRDDKVLSENFRPAQFTFVADPEISDEYATEAFVTFDDFTVAKDGASHNYQVSACNSLGCSRTQNVVAEAPPPEPVPPLVLGFAPLSGPVKGGTPVAIMGKGFVSDDTKVKFGDVEVESGKIVVKANNLIAVISPPHKKGRVSITVTTPHGTSSSILQFNYTEESTNPNPDPIINSIEPSSGPIAGNTEVKIKGKHFKGSGVKVFFGQKEGVGCQLNAASDLLSCKTPPVNQPKTVDVKVTVSYASGSKSAVRSGGFTYKGSASEQKPVIESVTPARGPIAGGTQVTIVGKNFVAQKTSVFFGNKAGIGCTVNASGTQISCKTPKVQQPKFVNVKVSVVGASGPIERVKQNGFEYISPKP